MGKHLDPLQKEFLIRRYLSNPETKLSDFCDANGISNGAFRKWLKQYETQGLEGLARAASPVSRSIARGSLPSLKKSTRIIHLTGTAGSMLSY